ncbi:fungal-specific transcription factor domain-containing protein, partial [Mycena filopes]
LITSLVQVYFATVHPTFPILHRPSFERPLSEGLHLTDHDFGGLLLAVLAVASRYSDDPRVLVEGDDTSLSAGWKYANQIQIILWKSVDPSIYEVQMYALCSLYVLGTSRPEVCTLYTDLGISCLRLRGEYRRKRDEHNMNLQDEAWRRVFWRVSYLVFDRMGCVFHGRPPGFDLEDEDVDLPLEVDDEYWERGSVQPLGKPPLHSYLVQHARLCIILGDAMRRLYVSTETKMRYGWHGPEWERSTVAELDSAMNDFLDSIPPHLRWDPVSPPQGTFFDQSLALHVAYQHIQIMIHRPYIHKMGALAGPALSICTGAARSILHMASVWLKKWQKQPPILLNSVFVSGIILVLNMFITKRAHAGLSVDVKKDLAHVDAAMEVMKVLEARFQPAGRLRELLSSLAAGTSVDAAPLHLEHPTASESAADFAHPLPGHGHSQIHLEPGVSIEQLLAATATPFYQDDVLMAMWTDVPADFANLNEWDAYIGNLSTE